MSHMCVRFCCVVFMECWAQFAEKGEICGGYAGTPCNKGLSCDYSLGTAGRCRSGGFLAIFHAPRDDRW
ncbi:hypothetical protein DPMN_145805 [Dreissena polymorpha]|uniref:Secreted protein n=1 Tax=Dreissena polymorpha TaxID=45954 RepID=A0A9D4F963_DREPO|nr:hypothetical protein DPMN_145805 [Dreissena polymorpha]